MADDKMANIADAADNKTDIDEKRGRSTIEFPYVDLDDCVEVATGVHQAGGSGCQIEQLAAQLKQVATGGGFRLRLIGAKIFGVLTYDRGAITLTPLGMRIVDAQHVKQSRVEAFLSVPLFKAIYEKFRGVSLPPTAGLEREIEMLGVAPKQKDKARQVLQRSAKQAGFFDYGPDRLVLPAGTSENGRSATAKDDPVAPPPAPRRSSSGDGGGGDEHHPFIQGLLKTLPQPESDWTVEQRARWLQTAAGIFDLIYKGNEEGRAITVKAEPRAS
jgi:hypothetical protein